MHLHLQIHLTAPVHRSFSLGVKTQGHEDFSDSALTLLLCPSAVKNIFSPQRIGGQGGFAELL